MLIFFCMRRLFDKRDQFRKLKCSARSQPSCKKRSRKSSPLHSCGEHEVMSRLERSSTKVCEQGKHWIDTNAVRSLCVVRLQMPAEITCRLAYIVQSCPRFWVNPGIFETPHCISFTVIHHDSHICCHWPSVFGKVSLEMASDHW